jgi:type IV pilus assembly protein PilM
MAKGNLLLGLDIGSTTVKICLLKELKRGYQLRAFAMEPLPDDTIVDGVVMNSTAVVETIRSLVSRNRIKQKDCAISVSGFSVIVKRISVSLMTDQELERQFHFEVENHIPYDMNDVFVDKHVLRRNPTTGQMDMLLVAAKREIVNERLDLTRSAGLTPRIVDVDCFCLQNMFETLHGEPEGNVALVDVGATTTSIVITTDGMTAFTRDLLMGGDQFTEELQRQLGLSREVAEQVKRGEAEPAPGMEAILQRACEAVSQEIQRSFNFFEESSATSGVSRVVLCGGAAHLAPLRAQIAQLSGVPVEVIQPFSRLQYDSKVYNPDYLQSISPQAAVAIGLALRRSVA